MFKSFFNRKKEGPVDNNTLPEQKKPQAKELLGKFTVAQQAEIIDNELLRLGDKLIENMASKTQLEAVVRQINDIKDETQKINHLRTIYQIIKPADKDLGNFKDILRNTGVFLGSLTEAPKNPEPKIYYPGEHILLSESDLSDIKSVEQIAKLLTTVKKINYCLDIIENKSADDKLIQTAQTALFEKGTLNDVILKLDKFNSLKPKSTHKITALLTRYKTAADAQSRLTKIKGANY